MGWVVPASLHNLVKYCSAVSRPPSWPVGPGPIRVGAETEKRGRLAPGQIPLPRGLASSGTYPTRTSSPHDGIAPYMHVLYDSYSLVVCILS
jgi:hypothetical protein